MAEAKAPTHLPILQTGGQSSSDDLPSRRRFLALFGASAALATGAGCKGALDRRTVVPYTKRQEQIVPGVADYYASTFQEGEVAYPVLVKAREGRPIHVEGNDEHPLYRGKTNLRAIADLLSLYDPDRLRQPRVEGQATTWQAALARVAGGCRAVAGQSVVLLTGAVLSPSRRALLARLAEAVPGLRHLQWEPAADHVGGQVERALLGEIRPRRYDFAKAEVILSLEADFLGTLGNTVTAIAGFSSHRRPAAAADGMNRLCVLEGGLSLTGSRADVRLPIRPSALSRIAFGLLRAVHQRCSGALPPGMDASVLEGMALEEMPETKPFAPQLHALVQDLCAAGPRALVLAGPAAPPEAHAASWLLNHMLGAIGSTVLPDDTTTAPNLATPEEMAKLAQDMAAGRVAALLFWDANPVYDHGSPADASDGQPWRAALDKVPLRVRLGLLPDETTAGCNVILPVNHWLESWNDFEASGDTLALQQPVVAPLYDTLQGEDILLRWLAELGQPAQKSYLEFVKTRWRDEVQPKDSPIPFAAFWNACVHDGLFQQAQVPSRPPRAFDGAACSAAARQAGRAAARPGFELVLDADPRLYDGRYANNGWLQELPDPVTRVCWGNPLAMAPADAERLHLENGDLVTLGAGPALPVIRQPGQAGGVLHLTLGHGRWEGNVAARIGTRAWAFAPAGARVVPIAKVERTGGHQELALAQMHDTRDGRDIARAWTLADFAGRPHQEREHQDHPSLYPSPTEREPKGPRWGMAIDLSACVGCGACVVACQSENNIPVVGPEQVRKGRAMHWIRIDRYYEGDETAPGVLHQPMLCQHCDNAPCETVCPVQATNHGPDGINEMAYNRCVGTRYCANNCPYKVRRFNFFDFTGDTPPSLQLAFNPEVSVRPRGVMEKCTFCVQRIRNADQVAKRGGRGVRDGDVVTACAAACPASAIVFGDIADPQSPVSRLARNQRGFVVLEELGTKPAITYLAQLKNPSGAKGQP